MNSNSDNNSDNELMCTPPEVRAAAEANTLHLLPSKSKSRYEQSYNKFMNWRKANKVRSFSENILLAYFGLLANKYSPNTLWSHFAMLKCTLNIHDNIKIQQYSKLIAFIKRKNVGYEPKKSKTLTNEEIQRFITAAPDETFLLAKVSSTFVILTNYVTFLIVFNFRQY